MKLDKTDLKILKKLQQDGRMTNLQLSVEIGLSPAPTLERVKKLESSGVIKSYHAQVSEHVVGLGIQALVSISLTRQIENAIAGFTQTERVLGCKPEIQVRPVPAKKPSRP